MREEIHGTMMHNICILYTHIYHIVDISLIIYNKEHIDLSI